MVMNVGFLKSGKYDQVRADIAAVREATKYTSLKVIIEAMLLDRRTDHQSMRDRCGLRRRLCQKRHRIFCSSNDITPYRCHEESCWQTAARSKRPAESGRSTLLTKMHAMGVTRFGIGYNNAIVIAEEAMTFNDEIEIPDIRIEDYL